MTHVGMDGDPTAELHYRLLYTHLKSWGSYSQPLADPQSERLLLMELSYSPVRFDGWSLTGAIGVNSGHVLRSSAGLQITLRKKGWLRW